MIPQAMLQPMAAIMKLAAVERLVGDRAAGRRA